MIKQMKRLNRSYLNLKFLVISGLSMASALQSFPAFSDYSTHVVGKIRSVNRSYVEITGYHIVWQVALADLSAREVERVKGQIATQKEIDVWVPASRLKYRVENAPSNQDRLPAGSQGWANYL